MAKHGAKKQPKVAIEVTDQKHPQIGIKVDEKRRPVEGERVEYLHLKASWRVKRVQMVDPYGWHQLTGNEIAAIQAKLAEFESMTWSEIFVLGRKRNHKIPIVHLRCPQAKHWLRNNLPDQTELWTLRFTGAQRVWGIFAEGAYQIIFWDPHHQIMPTLQ